MNKLVRLLSEYLKNGEDMNSPTSVQYSFYIDIFIDEILDGDCHHIDNFSEQLAIGLIDQGLEPTGNFGGVNTNQHDRYNKFYMAWYNWCLIFRRLKREGLLISK